MTNHTAAAVLVLHDIATADMTDDQTTDAARDAGVLSACLGCGSLVAAPDGMTTDDYKSANPWFTPEVQATWAECCDDADSVTY